MVTFQESKSLTSNKTTKEQMVKIQSTIKVERSKVKRQTSAKNQKHFLLKYLNRELVKRLETAKKCRKQKKTGKHFPLR